MHPTHGPSADVAGDRLPWPRREELERLEVSVALILGSESTCCLGWVSAVLEWGDGFRVLMLLDLAVCRPGENANESE